MRRVDLLKDKLEFLQTHGGSAEEIAELEKSIKRSKQGRSSKTKGANFERSVVEKLNKLFPKLQFGRTVGSGGYKKDLDVSTLRGDVVSYSDKLDFLLHMELKNHKGLTKLWAFYKQAEDDALKGKVPTVVLHRGQEAGRWKAEDFILIKFQDFFNLVDYKKLVKDK